MVDAKTQTLKGTFVEGTKDAHPNNVFFEEFTSYFGYNLADKKGIEMSVRPDLSSNVVVIGDNSTTSNWGMGCTPENSCIISSTPCASGIYYLGIEYPCIEGATNLYFNKDQKYADFKDHSLQVQFTSMSNSTWPLKDAALVGMGPKSTYLTYVLNTYKLNNDDTYE